LVDRPLWVGVFEPRSLSGDAFALASAALELTAHERHDSVATFGPQCVSESVAEH
jgi:hypothetical protein